MADHVGVYRMGGDVMVVPTNEASATTLPFAFEQPRSASVIETVVDQPAERNLGMASYTYNATGTVIPITSSSGWGYDNWIGEFSSSRHEVTRLNAFFSGTEPIDSYVSRDLFYAKGPAGQSGRFRYSVYKRLPTLSDLYLTPPETAPSASTLATNRAYDPGGVRVSVSMTLVGYTTGTMNSTGSLVVGTWQAYLSMTTDISGAATSPYIPPQLVTASTANVVYVGSNWAVVTGAYAPAGVGHPLLVFNIAQDSSGKYLSSSGMTWPPPEGQLVKVLSWVPLSSSVSGVYLNNTIYAPFTVPIDVTSPGKIKDLRAWIELVHDERGNASGTVDPALVDHGLQGLALALRSPNMSFRSSHPLWNDPRVATFPVNNDANVAIATGTLAQKFGGVPSLYQSSYLLWAGHGVDDGLRATLSDPNISTGFHEFDNDIDMRTVFWDGSPINNPRDISVLYPNMNSVSPGAPLDYNVLTGTSYQKYYQSPTLGAILAYRNGKISGLGPASSSAFPSGTLTCSNLPWMFDSRLSPAGGLGASGTVTQSSTLPPAGWLNGLGGASAPGEFNTSGTQFGPATIRPVYPILDDAYALKVWDDTRATGSFQLGTRRGQVIGVRPGLRGSELSGTWQLLIGTAASHVWSTSSGYPANSHAGVWLRQARIETIADMSASTYSFVPGTSRRYDRPANVGREGYQRVAVESGSCAWDVGLSYVQVFQPPEYGRSVSITDATASVPDSYAVLTFITGDLYTQLSSAGVFNPSWFLGGNGFGTPYIPDSSMSLGTGSAEQIDAAAAAEIFKQAIDIQTIVPGANEAAAFLNRQGYARTALQRWEEAVAASGSSSGYFPGL